MDRNGRRRTRVLVRRRRPPPKAPSGPDIEAGRKFWSFQPLSRVAPPEVRDESWAHSPIDRFILSRLEQKNLRERTGSPGNPDPPGLSRPDRRSPDTRGGRFVVHDTAPDAWEKLIDSLLASPAYGERGHAIGSTSAFAETPRASQRNRRAAMALLQELDTGTPIRTGEATVTLTIDGRRVSVPPGTSVMAAAALIDNPIPKLCATDSVEAFGSCRLCLVEIEGRRARPRPARHQRKQA